MSLPNDLVLHDQETNARPGQLEISNIEKRIANNGVKTLNNESFQGTNCRESRDSSKSPCISPSTFSFREHMHIHGEGIKFKTQNEFNPNTNTVPVQGLLENTERKP